METQDNKPSLSKLLNWYKAAISTMYYHRHVLLHVMTVMNLLQIFHF